MVVLAVSGVDELQARLPRSGLRVERLPLPELAPSSVAIGFPEGVGVGIDPVRGAVSVVWLGEFVDVSAVRPGAGKLHRPLIYPGLVIHRERGAGPLRLGEPTRRPTVDFAGYRVLADSIELRTRVDGHALTETLRVMPDRRGLERRIETGERQGTWSYVADDGTARTLVRDGQGRLVLDLIFPESARPLLPRLDGSAVGTGAETTDRDGPSNAGVGAATAATTGEAAYRLENVALPVELRGGLAGVTFAPGGALVLATRLGEIWMRTREGFWRCFARGLDEPMGLIAESEREVVVTHRPELLRLTDADGDGVAETFAVVSNHWGQSANYHEFFFGLKRDAAGDYLGALSLTSTADKTPLNPATVRGAHDPTVVLAPTGHRSDLPWRGWAVALAADGTVRPLASGFRQPAGIGLSPQGEIFVTDNQGDFKAACGLLHVTAGDFHGHASSLKWETGFRPGEATLESLWARAKPPAIVFPHGVMGISAGEPVWDTTGGRFGPYAGQVFVGDFGRVVVRASLERVAGVWQGACFTFLGRNEMAPHVTGDRLIGGVMHAGFSPEGELYLAATAGWGAGADGLQRVVWEGRAPADLRDIRLTRAGFRITFTQPMDAASLADAANYTVNRFRYYYQPAYGSPRVDEERVKVTGVGPALDGRSVELELEGLSAGFVHEIALPGLRTASGGALANPLGYYTVNRLLDGTGPAGGVTRLQRPGESAPGSMGARALETTTSVVELRAAGEGIYRLYCAACHQPDGRGIPGGAANFRDDPTRLAKPDAELLAVIAGGLEGKGMPAFGEILPAGQRRAVLAYLRDAFGLREP